MRQRIPRALVRQSVISVSRLSAGSDSEGNPNGVRTTVPGITRGTWRELSASEQLLAAQRGTKSQRELAVELGLDLQAGDFVASDGASWEAVDVDDLHAYRRALMRKEQ